MRSDLLGSVPIGLTYQKPIFSPINSLQQFFSGNLKKLKKGERNGKEGHYQVCAAVLAAFTQ
jgi:hypothetical protein